MSTFQLTLNGTNRSARLSETEDTGAKSNLWGLECFRKAGFKQRDLKQVIVKIRTANNYLINIIGVFWSNLQWTITKQQKYEQYLHRVRK